MRVGERGREIEREREEKREEGEREKFPAVASESPTSLRSF